MSDASRLPESAIDASGKIRVLVDLDGVVRDFVTGLKRVYQNHFPGHAVQEITSRNLEAFFPIGEKIYPFMDETHAEEILTTAPPYPGALEALARWEKHFHIVVVTAQPPQGRAPTFLWLGKHRVATAEVHVRADKETVSGFALLDDFDDNLERFARTGRLAVCLDRPWNRNWKGPRVHSVEAFFRLVRKKLTEQ